MLICEPKASLQRMVLQKLLTAGNRPAGYVALAKNDKLASHGGEKHHSKAAGEGGLSR